MIKTGTKTIGTIDIIEIYWKGPFKITKIGEKRNKDYDSGKGIYQIYGTHNIYGPETLLYIGKTQDRTFAERFSEHKEWVEWEPTGVDVYIGKLGGKDKMTESNWGSWNNQIDRAERLLIFFCSPPYNSQGLNNYGEMDPTIVLNYGKSMRLPFEASNLDDYCAIGKSGWKEYVIK